MSLFKSCIFLAKKTPPALCGRVSSLLFTKNKCLVCELQRYYSDKPSSSVEVYYGALTPQIRGVKMFSLITSAAGIIAQPILYQQVVSFGGGMSLTLALGSFIGFFTFVTPFLLHSITKKYVAKIDYSSQNETYTATLYTFFLRPRLVTFRPEDVEVPDIPGMFTSFHIKGKPVFVDPRLFPDTKHYAKILGYDKPIDFKLEDYPEDPAPQKTNEPKQ